MSNPWPDSSRIPRGPAAVLAALHLTEPRVDGLKRLSEVEWRNALEFADHARLTLALRDRARDAVPPAVRERLDRNAAANLQRLAKIGKL